MKDFDWTRFELKVLVKAPLEKIYGAWTTKKEIERWFLKEAVFLDVQNNKIGDDVPVISGNTYAWSWYLYSETETGRINIANGNDHIRFTFAGNCLVDVFLKQVDEFTEVTLVQSGIPTDDHSKKEIRLGCHTGWSFYLVNLKSVYEGGIDLRNKNTEFKPMVNN